MKKRTIKGFKLFNILTWCMIGIMFYYIFAKLASLVVTGETRQILIIEAKQLAVKKIRTIVCNEILTSDEYLTEDRLIQLTKIQQSQKLRTRKDKEIDQFVSNLGTYKESLEDRIVSIKNSIKKNVDLISTGEEKEVSEKYTDKEIKKRLNAYNDKGHVLNNTKIIQDIIKIDNTKELLNRFYIVDGQTSIEKNMFRPQKLLSINNKIKKDKTKPQILIYHTHSTEGYVDSRKGRREDTVVGIGEYLSNILVNDYGYNVIHNTKAYDIAKGKWNRNAYDVACPSIKQILKNNPSIQVVIDLHRDSGKKKEVTNINGVNVAKVMFFNGVSRSVTGNRKEFSNPNLIYNLSFSLAMKLQSMSMYKDFTKKIYIKGYRYNMHLAKKYTLIEVGNNKNTVAEAKNSMILYAKILDRVLD